MALLTRRFKKYCIVIVYSNIARLAGIEPALTVPKTVVLSVERQAPFDKLRVNLLYPSTFLFEYLAVGVGKPVGFITELLQEE